MKKSVKLLLLTVLCVLTVMSVSFISFAEGSSINDAEKIVFNQTVSSAISVQKENDYYRFDLSIGGRITLNFTSYIHYYVLTIYDVDGKQVWYSGSQMAWDSTTEKRSDTFNYDLSKGTYYIKVEGRRYDNSREYFTGNYNFKVSFKSSGENVAEPNNSIPESATIKFNKLVKGFISKSDYEDYYHFNVPDSGKVTLDFTSFMKYYVVTIFNNDGKQVWYSGSQMGWNETTQKRSDTYSYELISGDYYIRVEGRRYDNSREYYTGCYQFTLSYDKAYENIDEPNDTMQQAEVIPLGFVVRGQIAMNDSVDFYAFEVSRKMKMSVSVTSYMSSYQMNILDYDGNSVFDSGYLAWNENAKRRSDIHSLELEEGTYFIKMTGAAKSGSATGNYQLIVTDNKPGKVSNLKYNSGENYVRLTWTAAANATGYRIYGKSSSGWKALNNTTNKSVAIGNLKAGTNYVLGVKAFTKSSNGSVIWADEMVTINVTTAAAKPAKVAAAQNASAIKLSWSACKGADGYRIFYRTNTKSAWKVALKATAKTSHTFTGLPSAQGYQFAIRPYISTDNGILWSDYKIITTATAPAKVTTKAASSSAGKVTVAWSSVKGATGYALYYKVGNGSFKLYKNYTSAGTIKLSAASGKKCTVAVRAYKTVDGKQIYGAYNQVSVTVK